MIKKTLIYLYALILCWPYIARSQQVKEYFITCSPDSFQYIYDNYKTDYYIYASLEYAGKTWPKVELRIRGDSSRSFPKKSLKIKFNDIPFITGRDVLNFNAEYLDHSYLHSVLTSLVMQKSGQLCFNAEYARVYLNNQFLGLYVLIENMDSDFLNANKLDANGNLYKATLDGACLSIYDDVDYHWEKKTNENVDRNDLKNLIKEINQVNDDGYYAFTKEFFDYDKMINIIAMNMLIANGSTYYHNYYLYHDIHNTNKWMMLPWDVDRTFSKYGKNLPYHYSSNAYAQDNPFLERAIMDETIFQDIQKRITDLKNIFFNLEYLNPVIDSLSNLIVLSVHEDQTDEIPDTTYWRSQIDKEIDFIANRYDKLQYQFMHYPKSFQVSRILKTVTDSLIFRWGLSVDPNNEPVTYQIRYGKEKTLRDVNTVEINNISNNEYTFDTLPEDGDYYWAVSATDGKNWTNGYDTFNKITIKRGSVIPAMIDKNTTLDKKHSPYIFMNDVIIHENITMDVDPGVEIQLTDSVKIVIQGSIRMNGTQENPIFIHPNINAHACGGLYFYGNNEQGQSSLNHVWFENMIGDSLHQWASIYVNQSNLFLNNVNFIDNLAGIYSDQSSLEINDCKFYPVEQAENISIEDYIFISYGNVMIENCTFQNTISNDIIDINSAVVCIIKNNKIMTALSEGIDLAWTENATIENNLLYNCKEKGISVEKSSSAYIEKNVIVGSDIGIGVYDNSFSMIDHNTLYNNNTSIFISHGKAEVWNTILANSTTLSLRTDDTTNVKINYSLSNTELLNGTGNIFASPLFVSPADTIFKLKSNSPCIDRGSPRSPLDEDETRSDIGAYSYYLVRSLIINEINYNSNVAFNPEDWIELYNPSDRTVDVFNFYFQDSNKNHIFNFPNVQIEDHGYLVLCRNQTVFQKYFPEVTNVIGNFDFGLSGQGEHIRIYNSSGIIIDSLTFDDTSPWPKKADGDGATLELKSPLLDNSKPENWGASLNHGTPGRRNSLARKNQKLCELFQNYPNPANTSTTIAFDLFEPGSVELNIFNITGQRVQYFQVPYQSKGIKNINWDVIHFSSGLYFYQIIIDNEYTDTKKAIVIK